MNAALYPRYRSRHFCAVCIYSSSLRVERYVSSCFKVVSKLSNNACERAIIEPVCDLISREYLGKRFSQPASVLPRSLIMLCHQSVIPASTMIVCELSDAAFFDFGLSSF